MTSQVHPEQMSVPDGNDVELKSYDGPASLDDEHIEAKPEVDAEGQLGIAVLPPIKQNKANAVNVDVSNGGTPKTKKEHEFTNIPLDNKDSKEKEEKEQKVASTNPFRMSDWIDKMLMIVGVLAACIHGMTMPFTVRIFSDAVDMFVEDEKRRSMIGDGVTGITLTDVVDEVRPICEKLAVWAVVIVIAGSMHVACWKLTAERQVSRMRALLFKTILRQDCAWFTMHETGSLIVTLTNDMVHIEAGISDKVSLSVQHFAVFFVSVVMAIERSWKLTLTVLSLTPILIGALIASGMIISKSGQRETEAYSRAGSIAQEVLSSIKTVTAFNGQTKEKLRYDDCLGVSRYVGIMRGALFGGSLGVMLGCTFWIISLANYYGIKLMSEAAARGSNEYSGGEIIFVRANYCKHKIKVIMVILTGSMSLGQCLPNIEGIMAAGGSAINIYDVIDSVPIIDSSSDEGLKPETLNGNVELRDVEFSYPSRMDVQILKKLNLSISVGQTVALVGASGSGKSTICQLLLRLYDTNKGQVLIDGTDVQSYNVNWLRKHVGIVSQEPILFAMTIAENIRLAAGRDDVTDDDIVNAAKMANAHNFIMQWPDKYNTLVGERGAQMSGGQKQRIAIARALISNPKILLLDEATSALDSESEAIVQAALDQASEGRTTIIVAHRLSTIRNADVIYCMKAGVLVESGNHETLMQRKGYYYDLVTTQQSTKVKENQDLVKTKSIDEEEKVKEEDEKPSKLKLLEKQESVYSLKGKDDEIEIDTSFYMRLLRLNQSDWFYMLIGCLSASCVGASQPCFSLVYSSMMMNFASLDPINQFDSAKKFSLGVFFFAIAIAIVYMLQFWMFSIVGENLTQRLRRMVFGALLRQEVAWYDLQDNRVGVLTSRLAADATMVRGVSGTQLGLIVQAMASLLVALVISFVSGWKLALMIMCFVPFLVASGIAHGKDIQGGAVQSQRAADEGGKVNMPGKYYDVILGKCSDIALEAMSNIRTVAALTIENVFHVKYCNFFKEFERKQQISAIKSGFFYGIGQSISQFCYAATFFYGAYLIRENEMVFSNVFRVVLALIMAAMSVGRSTSFAPEVNKAKIAARNIFSLVDRKSAVDPEQTKGKRPESCIGDVTFENLYFSYPTRPEAPVLQGLNIAIKAGQKVALVGSSGCGKSTSVSLIERFYLPASGIVRIDGIDVTTLNVQWLRSQIGLVSQEPILFNTSIFENIVYGDNSRSPSMDEVITAAKGANIHSFITALPQGYETNVGESGGQLSGGQKQRIAIARVLLRDAKILLLDEATSALDTESEKQVQDALDVAQKGRTSIIIAHRLSTIKTADIIVVLKEGQVIEQGSHDELMSKKGSYYNLVMIQTGH